MRYGLADVEADGVVGQVLYRIEDNGDQLCLGTDAMEPEDSIFARDLKWVPEELNRLAGIIAEREAELQRTYECINSHAKLTWAAQDEAKRLRAVHALWGEWLAALRDLIVEVPWPGDAKSGGAGV